MRARDNAKKLNANQLATKIHAKLRHGSFIFALFVFTWLTYPTTKRKTVLPHNWSQRILARIGSPQTLDFLFGWSQTNWRSVIRSIKKVLCFPEKTSGARKNCGGNPNSGPSKFESKNFGLRIGGPTNSGPPNSMWGYKISPFSSKAKINWDEFW